MSFGILPSFILWMWPSQRSRRCLRRVCMEFWDLLAADDVSPPRVTVKTATTEPCATPEEEDEGPATVDVPPDGESTDGSLVIAVPSTASSQALSSRASPDIYEATSAVPSKGQGSQTRSPGPASPIQARGPNNPPAGPAPAPAARRPQVVRAINALLLHRLVRFGDPDAAIVGFATLGFPNCFGALDGTHIPIHAPEHSGVRYLNRKGYHSVVLQALVDSQGHFLDIYVGWPGSTHNTRVSRNSGLCRRLQAGTYIPQREIPVGDTTMPLCVIADAAYPLRPWLMHPYTGHLSASQERFNQRLNHVRQVVECTFGHLKGRWRCLLTRLDAGPTNIPQIVGVCSALHNLVESKGEAFFQGWAVEAGRADVQPPAASSCQVHPEGTRAQEALRAQFNEATG
ncbi:uncharacterized protein LOC142023941 [Carettochelys insculpta]|uniref:uncharacterized protein LOC142023941 n=1 Tax=Carettochelys insculpta TaxID=44489 RepID=UPI003EBB0E62